MSTIPRRLISVVNPDARIGFQREAWDDEPFGRVSGDDFLTIDGRLAIDLGFDCPSCTFIFERIDPIQLPVSALEFSSLLADGLTEINDSVLEVASKVVPTGDYLAVLVDFQPSLVSPGATDDYFANEYRGTADREHDPGQSYYRGPAFRFEHGQAFHDLAVPLYDPALCDSARVNEFRLSLRGGSRPTALAVSFCDVVDRGGWFGIQTAPEANYAPREFEPNPKAQLVLTHYVLDGHHKMRAAAEEGRTLTMLSLIRGKVGDRTFLRRADEMIQILEAHR